jgi:inositol-pentakisphosphate 2-kinase
MDSTGHAEIRRDLQSSQTGEWTYLAEGGAHLVFAYRGSVPSLRHKVLRVRKEHIESPSIGTSEISDFERARVYFARTITPALLPPDLLPMEWRVSVDAGWIRALERDSVGVRPESRTSLRSSLSEDQQSLSPKPIEVSLVENLLGERGDMAIEIKVSLHPCSFRTEHISLTLFPQSQNADSYPTRGS